MLTQRLSPLGQIDNEYVDKLIQITKNNPGSCDEIWFTCLFGYPKYEDIVEFAEKLKPVAEKFRENGIRVSLQISNTIGHGDHSLAMDCSGLVFEGSPAELLMGAEGAQAKAMFCWRGEFFKNYIIKGIAEFAKLNPHTIWIDDDFRSTAHKILDCCFCENCIKKFNERYGYSFTREELVDEINYGDIAIRKEYMEFTKQGLYDLMYQISKKIHEISPDTYMGLQYGIKGSWVEYGYNFILKAMEKGSGKTPKTRPGGGAYWAHNPNEFIYKAKQIEWSNFLLYDKNIEKRPEIECLPNVVYGKSPQNICFETTIYLAVGSDAMSYAMIQERHDPLEYHERIFRLFSAHRPYWERLVEINKKTVSGGFNIAYDKEGYLRKVDRSEKLFAWREGTFHSCDELWDTAAIPTCFNENNDGVVLLHPEVAKGLTDDEIEKLLAKPVITDGKAIKLITERGFKLPVTCNEISAGREVMTDHVVNSHISGSGSWNFNYYVVPDAYKYEIVGDDVEVVSKYNVKGEEKGVACAIFDTKKGGKWAIFGMYSWCGIMSFDKRNQFFSIGEYISGKPISVKLETPIQAVVIPRETEDGKVACVTVVNKTVGDTEELEFTINNPVGEKFTFVMVREGKVQEEALEYTKDGNAFKVKVKNIPGWGIGTIFID